MMNHLWRSFVRVNIRIEYSLNLACHWYRYNLRIHEAEEANL